ncbi:Arc family DNA-binding protein [Agrobacterium tumefaciens]|nr:Arc family DNA-binding protein [Agrobacterium tumefaciens]TQN59585.1 Arc family DNA-binding protein [Agrobacterium tumefaciens]
MEKEEMDRFTLRCPVDLLIELKVMAARSRRSLNSQVIALLDEAVKTAKNEKGAEPLTA